MIRHLFKLAWNRRRANALLLIELVACFLVLCLVLTMVAQNVIHWRKPLGFEYENVWRMNLLVPNSRVFSGPTETDDLWKGHDRMMLALRGMEEIEAASPLDINVPFSNSMMSSTTPVNGSPATVRQNLVTPEAMDVLRLELIAGRWLENGDEFLEWKPVVVTRDYARLLFGDENPLGETIVTYRADGTVEEREGKEKRIVGVVADYRPRGELFPAEYAEFYHVRSEMEETWVPRHILVRLLPGTPRSFEEKLVRSVQQVLPDHTVSVSSLATERESTLRSNLMPLAIYGTIALFLIIMAGLGIIGVLWQSVTRRTEEWGVRRAFGATARSVRTQVIGELMALALIAVAIGGVLFVQLPILHVFRHVPWAAYVVAFTASLAITGTFVLVCGAYPSWLATRVHPAEALQYE